MSGAAAARRVWRGRPGQQENVAAYVGARIRQERNRRHWTTSMLADKAFGVRRGSRITSYEWGTREITAVALCRIAAAFGMSPALLLPCTSTGPTYTAEEMRHFADVAWERHLTGGGEMSCG